MTCETCKHSVPVDPLGSWSRHGFRHKEYTHCDLSLYGKAHVLWRQSPCTIKPSEWVAK